MTDKFFAGAKADYENYEFHRIVQELHKFCSEDLGGFYLDILKDRLYTAGVDSKARRSAQNALHVITRALLYVMAPVLSFTAEEAWALVPGEKKESIFLTEWKDIFPSIGDGQALDTKWAKLRGEVRLMVTQHIEIERVAGKVGSSLACELDIYAGDDERLYESLISLGDDLRFVYIVSAVRVHRGGCPENSGTTAENSLWVKVTPSTYAKCERCWHYRADVGADTAHPHICGRCVSNLYGAGEPRTHA